MPKKINQPSTKGVSSGIKAYTGSYLKGRTTAEIFLKLDQKRVLFGAPEFCTPTEFCLIFGKTQKLIEGAKKKGLIIYKGTGEDDYLINLEKTWKVMEEYFQEQQPEHYMEQASEISDTHRKVDIEVNVDPKDVDKFKINQIRPDELEYLRERWSLIAGEDVPMPNLQERVVKRLLWNLRGLHVTKMLLDGMPNESILMHMMDQWLLSYKQSKRIILQIEKSIGKSVDQSKRLMVGKAYMRYERLYYKAFKRDDIRTAAVINKQICDLFGIDMMAKEMKESGESAEDGHLAVLHAIESSQGQTPALPPPDELEDDEEDDTDKKIQDIAEGVGDDD